MRRGSRTAARALFCALALLGCFGTPTPLAPNLRGSVGWPHHGVQTDATELPVSGPGFARYRSRGPYHWGQPALVQAIMHAAARVHETLPGGAPLMVGDLSAQYGGKIMRHQSHRSGRDVDLLWYITSHKGKSIPNQTFVRVGKDGIGRPPGRAWVRLDVARQWLLIKELIGSPFVEVQWLYCSSPVEALLIEHAVASGEDPELVWRAQHVLLEPADSLPHDDHLHLRVACSPDDSLSGCEGGGPYWNWLPALPTLLPAESADAAGQVGWL